MALACASRRRPPHLSQLKMPHDLPPRKISGHGPCRKRSRVSRQIFQRSRGRSAPLRTGTILLDIAQADPGRPLAGVDLKLNPKLSSSQMLKLRDLLTEHPGDVPVTLEMHLADRTVRIATPDNLRSSSSPRW
jgi:hypothetical protein